MINAGQSIGEMIEQLELFPVLMELMETTADYLLERQMVIDVLKTKGKTDEQITEILDTVQKQTMEKFNEFYENEKNTDAYKKAVKERSNSSPNIQVITL